MTLVPPANRGPEPEKTAGERDLLISWLDWHRATMLAKSQGLDSAQLGQRSCPPSDLTLLGLIRHLTEIERNYFAAWAGITDLPHYYSDEDPDGDFNLPTRSPTRRSARRSTPGRPNAPAAARSCPPPPPSTTSTTRACPSGGCSSTSSASTPATTATPTSCAKPSTAQPASEGYGAGIGGDRQPCVFRAGSRSEVTSRAFSARWISSVSEASPPPASTAALTIAARPAGP